MYVEGRMVNVMRVANWLCIVYFNLVVLEMAGKAKVEYTVGVIMEDLVLDDLGIMMTVYQVLDLKEVVVYW